ncbi:sigma-54-dependent transcriptional regulator [Desulfovibrio ferrophilus]|uniref:Fis family transcriptional regulator n=1 Tax=Desulfovibrio ferrophilus TaxID=241368 RepID=A0A2Z6B3A4_9BACT|nr:sigma-54 dependent transcriptional regulator [Desulfovibrio ferrophilus]BBD10014.1 Fis family transcriptional regulator [Desulfovibrio ferrophilus]
MNQETETFGRILVIDDDLEVRGTMQSLLSRMLLECETAGTLADGLDALAASEFDLVFLDVRLPDGNGLNALGQIKGMPGSPEVIILTGQGDPDGAELAIQGGVWDYLVKPSPIKQTMLSVQRALKYHMEKKGATPVALDLDNMVGHGPEMKQVFDFIAQAARSHAGVLITGETGTGKELTAQTIHENSFRSGNRFVVVDCASLTETLLESTLFGHRRGAFTGADKDRTGLVKLADGGTLFLDEVGEMPMSTQKSFLRVLQEKRFRPVGETREEKSDFRIVSATNKNLDQMVESGHFRGDLLFRLKTMSMELPPLRCRLADIKLLAMHHVSRLCEQYDAPVKGFGSDFFEVLSSYDWPGNVRELFNVLERAFVAAGEERTLYAMHLPRDVRIKVAKASLGGGMDRPCKDVSSQAASGMEPRPSQSQSADTVAVPPVQTHWQTNPVQAPALEGVDSLFAQSTPSLKEFKSQMEKRYLEQLIAMHDGDVKAILAASGLSRSHFYALLKKNDVQMKAD